MLNIIDNFIDKNDFVKIQDILIFSNTFPWYFNQGVSYADCRNDHVYNFQLTHLFYNEGTINSVFFNNLNPLIKKLNPKQLIRIKANLIPVTEKKIIFDYHVDIDDVKCKTAVFYINTNNGHTIFQNSNSVDSVENRLLSFDSDILHTSTSCTDKKIRCVININYYEE